MKNLLKYSAIFFFIPLMAKAQISAIKFNVTNSCMYVIGKDTYKKANEAPPTISYGFTSLINIHQKIAKKYFIEYGGYFRLVNMNQKPIEAIFSDPIFPTNEPDPAYFQFKSRLLLSGVNFVIGRKFEITDKTYLNLSIGTGVNYTLESRERIVFLDESLDYLSDYNYYNTSKFRKFNYDCLVNLDISKQISKKMDASIGLNYSQFINSVYDDKQFNVYPFGIGLNLGLSYNFQK